MNEKKELKVTIEEEQGPDEDQKKLEQETGDAFLTELLANNQNEEHLEDHHHDDHDEEGGVEVHNDHTHPVKDDVYKL